MSGRVATARYMREPTSERYGVRSVHSSTSGGVGVDLSGRLSCVPATIGVSVVYSVAGGSSRTFLHNKLLYKILLRFLRVG